MLSISNYSIRKFSMFSVFLVCFSVSLCALFLQESYIFQGFRVFSACFQYAFGKKKFIEQVIVNK